MIDEGFDPDFGPAVHAELQNIGKHPDAGAPLKDLRALLWSSIDNDDTRDLDQIEFAEEISGNTSASGSGSAGNTPGEWRLYIAISDVDSEVPKGSAIDVHAAAQTTSVYTGAAIFSMIPPELSAGATSIFAGSDRKSMVIEMIIAANGTVTSAQIYRAMVTNKAQLAYSSVGAWLDSGAAIPKTIAE